VTVGTIKKSAGDCENGGNELFWAISAANQTGKKHQYPNYRMVPTGDAGNAVKPAAHATCYANANIQSTALHPGNIRGGVPGISSIKGGEMNGVKIAAIVLIVAGVLGLMYGTFTYTRQTHKAKVGPIEVSVQEKQRVNVPVWAGAGTILVGGVLLVFAGKKR
jgi:hypothetical protein